MSQGVNQSPLISAVELKQLLAHQNVKVFDVRGAWGGDPKDNQAQYAQSHIPSAAFIDWTTHFLTSNMPVALAPVASYDKAKSSFEALGICQEDTVILYDDYHHMMAGRIWWAMRYWGFSNVKVLNGGWRYWREQGFETSSENVEPSLGTFEPVKKDALLFNLETLIITKDKLNLVDSRGPINFKGNDEDKRSGHIPGAINIPFKDVLNDETGLFKDANELTDLFNKKLPDFNNRSVITSCGSGYAGTVTLLALAMIGIDAPLFDDSFSVWKARTDLPVAKGA